MPSIPAFENDGFLPEGVHDCDAAEFRTAMVDAFPRSTSRPPLFEYWELHRRALGDLLPVQEQWINGSYVTSKVEPGDVDIVTLFEGSAFDALPDHTKLLVRTLLLGKYTRHFWRCDSYPIPTYPPGHPNKVIEDQQRAYWESAWARSTRAAAGKGYLRVVGGP